MLNNDFVEEYRRLETPFNFNYSRYFLNSLGDIILSSNFVIDKNVITFENTNLGNNIYPENTNFIVDSMTMVSTNPDLDNYVPFKFSFSGQKPEIDFSQPDKVEIQKYGYLRNNNLGVLSNRFSLNRQFTVRPLADFGLNIKSIIRIHYGSSGRGFYIVYTDQNDDEYLSYINVGGGLSYRGNSNKILNNYIDTIKISDSYGNLEVFDLNGTSLHTFILLNDSASNVNGNMRIVALRDGNSVFDPVTGLTNVASYRYNPYQIVDITFKVYTYTNDYVFIFGTNSNIAPANPNRFLLKIIRYNHSYVDENNDPYINTRYEVIKTVVYPVSTLNALLEDIVFIHIDKYFLNSILWGITEDGIILRMDFSGDNLLVEEVLNTGIPNCSIINIGRNRDTITDVNYTIVSGSPLETIVTFIIGDKITVTRYPIGIIANTIRQGLDNLHFYYQSNLVIHNTASGEKFIFNYKDDPRLVNVSDNIRHGNINRYFNVSANTVDTFPSEIRFNISLNERYNKSPVYKYTFHYGEDRNYLYNINNNFVFNLLTEQGVNVKDLEIFKIIMDIRIRYTQEKSNPNKAVPRDPSKEIPLDELEVCLDECETGKTGKVPEKDDCKGKDCKTTSEDCKARCVKSLGGANRILGYVGEDFNVSDFLNIYTTR